MGFSVLSHVGFVVFCHSDGCGVGSAVGNKNVFRLFSPLPIITKVAKSAISQEVETQITILTKTKKIGYMIDYVDFIGNNDGGGGDNGDGENDSGMMVV